MQENKFAAENYFNLRGFSYSHVFDGLKNVWEVIPLIGKYTEGKLLQGENCKIASTALIREGVILGDNVVIGHCCELKNCIILDDTAIAHLNYIGDSVIGNNVNVSGGAILANFRLDRKPVKVKLDDRVVETGLQKFSSIIGDNGRIGVNAVLNPGTILGKNSIVYPLVSVKGTYSENSIIK